jgi:hypothetical protein
LGKGWTVAVLPRREEKELRELLRQTFLEEHPNPGRWDCPGSDILKAIASGKLRLEESEPWIHHFTSCSPCTREFEEFRKDYKKRRLRLVSGLSAGIFQAAVIVAGSWSRI